MRLLGAAERFAHARIATFRPCSKSTNVSTTAAPEFVAGDDPGGFLTSKLRRGRVVAEEERECRPMQPTSAQIAEGRDGRPSRHPSTRIRSQQYHMPICVPP
jgi:hypothetical protein